MKLLNYTPHEIVIVCDGKTHKLPSMGNARVSTSEEIIDYVNLDGSLVPITETHFHGVIGLPDPVYDRAFLSEQPEVYYIVSMRTQMELPNRNDLLSPNTGDSAIREDGRIVAVTALQRIK